MSVTSSWQDTTFGHNTSTALNDSTAPHTGMAAAVVAVFDDDPDSPTNVTMAMLSLDAEVAPSGGGDRHALLYIVVVLAFYAVGIIAALTMYLRQERADIDEEKVYDDYAAIHRDPWKWARYYRMQQVITRLHSLKMETEQRTVRADQGGEAGAPDDTTHLSDDLDELTIDIPRLLGDSSATQRMALPDGETVVVTFRMPATDGAVRGSRPTSLIRKRYETIDEERESVTDSDKSSQLGENGTTADNELSDDSLKEQRGRSGSGHSARRKRSFEQPLLTECHRKDQSLLHARYDKGEKDEFNILDEEEAREPDDASSETGFEPQDNHAMLRSWGIKPRISRWSDCLDLSELTSSQTDDHSDAKFVSSIGSPCSRAKSLDSDLEEMLPTMVSTNASSANARTPPVTIQYVLDEHADINQNQSKCRLDIYSSNSMAITEQDFDSDPTSLESTHKRQNFAACDLRWKSENQKLLKLPMCSSGTFKSSKPTDIDAAYKELAKPFPHSRTVYELVEANYSRSLPFLSAKGKPTDLDSVSQLLTLHPVDPEGGLAHSLRCNSSPSIPNCKASDVQFSRPDSSECYFNDQPQAVVPSSLLGVPGGLARLGQHPERLASSADGSLSSIENRLTDLSVPHAEPQTNPSLTGLILQPHDYRNNASLNKVPPLIPACNASTPPAGTHFRLTESSARGQGAASGFMKASSFHSSYDEPVSPKHFNPEETRPQIGRLPLARSLDNDTQRPTLHSPSPGLKSPGVRSLGIKSPALATFINDPLRIAKKSVGDPIKMAVLDMSSTDSISGSDGSLGLSDIDNPCTRGRDSSTRLETRTKEPARTPTTSQMDRDAHSKAAQAHSMLGPHMDEECSRHMSGAASCPGFDSSRDAVEHKRDRSAWSSEGSFLEANSEAGTSGDYTSCDEISLLADDHVYASCERVNTDFEDEDDDEQDVEEEEEISDEFASETFTELEKLADEGSIDNLVDDGCFSVEGSDLPLDHPVRDGAPNDESLENGMHSFKLQANIPNLFTDAKMSNAEEIIQKWMADNLKAGNILKPLKHPMSVKSSIPKATASTSYVQSSKRETTFLPDSHKCVSESTLGGSIISDRGAPLKPASVKPGTIIKTGTFKQGLAKPGFIKARAIKAGAVKPGVAKSGLPKSSSAVPGNKVPTALAQRKIPPAPARGGHFAMSVGASQVAARSLIARPTTAPISRLKMPTLRSRVAAGSPFSKNACPPAGAGAAAESNNSAGNLSKQSYPKADFTSAKGRPASTTAVASNGAVGSKRRPGAGLERSGAGPGGIGRQAVPGKYVTTSKIHQLTSKAHTRARALPETKAQGSGGGLAAGHKVKPAVTVHTPTKAGAQAQPQNGPHHVHGATSGLDMTPRTARRLTSRVTTI